MALHERLAVRLRPWYALLLAVFLAPFAFATLAIAWFLVLGTDDTVDTISTPLWVGFFTVIVVAAVTPVAFGWYVGSREGITGTYDSRLPE